MIDTLFGMFGGVGSQNYWLQKFILPNRGDITILITVIYDDNQQEIQNRANTIKSSDKQIGNTQEFVIIWKYILNIIREFYHAIHYHTLQTLVECDITPEEFTVHIPIWNNDDVVLINLSSNKWYGYTALFGNDIFENPPTVNKTERFAVDQRENIKLKLAH